MTKEILDLENRLEKLNNKGVKLEDFSDYCNRVDLSEIIEGDVERLKTQLKLIGEEIQILEA